MVSKYSIPEIERRWLVDLGAVGALDGLPRRRIVDRYMVGTSLRLRRIEGEGGIAFKLCKKEGGRLTNLYLTEAEYTLLATLPAEVIQKTRYTLAGGSLDIPDGPLPPRWERDFETEEAAAAFSPPPFACEEELGP